MTASTTDLHSADPTSGWRWGTAGPRSPGRRPTSCSPTTTWRRSWLPSRKDAASTRTSDCSSSSVSPEEQRRSRSCCSDRSSGLVTPLLAAQILWVNLLTHGLTGVAIGAEPVDPRVMDRPPRPPDQSILGAGLWQRVLLTSAVLTAATLVLAVLAHGAGRPWQTMLFVGLTSAQLGVALGLRPSSAEPGQPAAPGRGRRLAAAGARRRSTSRCCRPPGDRRPVGCRPRRLAGAGPRRLGRVGSRSRSHHVEYLGPYTAPVGPHNMDTSEGVAP